MVLGSQGEVSSLEDGLYRWLELIRATSVQLEKEGVVFGDYDCSGDCM